MNTKQKNVRFLSALLGLVFLSGCQAGSQSMGGLIPPKRTVPSLDQSVVPGEVVEERLESDQGEAGGARKVIIEGPYGMTGYAYGLPDPDFVSARFSHYKGKKEQWHSLGETLSMHDVAMPKENRWDECFRLVTEMEKAYGFLVDMFDGKVTIENQEQGYFSVLQHDVDFLGSDCETLFATAGSLIPGQLGIYGEIAGVQADMIVQHWAQEGENEKVVAAYENLLVVSSGKEPSLQSREEYARALKSLGHLEKAAVEMLKIADEKGAVQGWPLRMRAAEILFAQGDFAEARRQYEKVASLFREVEQGRMEVESQLLLLAGEKEHPREIDLYRRALHAWLIFDGKTVPFELANNVLKLEQSFPGSEYAQKGRVLFDQVGGNAQQYVRQEVLRARKLAEMKMFSQALSVLAPLVENADSEELLALVRQNQQEIEEIQGQEYAVEQERQKKALEAKRKEALDFFDHRQYDRAITAFKDLLHSEYAGEAKGKLDEAVDLAASALRKEAASLFLQSRRVQSSQQQTQLLMESRYLLLTILEKYPEAGVVDKARRNLQIIEEQIRGIDPSLLQ